jgi:dihydroxy-acid dehydratase
VLKRLIDAGRVAGDALTVTGHTLAEDAAHATETPGQQVVRPTSHPLKPHGGLVILFGNLAPEGAVLKLSGAETTEHRGPRACSTAKSSALRRSSGKPSSRVTSW